MRHKTNIPILIRKTVIIHILIFVSFYNLTCKSHSPIKRISFNNIYFYAIQEDVSKIIESINSIPTDSLTADQRKMKEKYNSRFLTRTEKFDFETTDSLIINALTIFQNYWTDVLMKKESLSAAGEKNRLLLMNFISSYNQRPGEIQRNNLNMDNMMPVLSNLLKQNGYYSRIDRTGNIMDLIIWTKQLKETYTINIADTVVNVPVIFIDSTITLGWEGYATFGHFYPGGWTSADTLYCIKKDYDISSEKFRVSYLTHETQHLLDAKTYSGYSRWMAEYRAKLAELSTAEQTVYSLIDAFIKGSKNDSRLTHPFAEHKLISDLSKDIFKEKFAGDMQKWDKVPYQEINKKAKELLKQNSITLTKIKHSL